MKNPGSMSSITGWRLDAPGSPPGGEHPTIYHTPVLLYEVLAALSVQPDGRYIDCTVGEGGHAQAILEAGAPDCRLLGLDADPWALQTAGARLKPFGRRVTLAEGNFATVGELARRHGFFGANGALMDLGISSMQLDGQQRGFSFRVDAPLDMRFSPSLRSTAGDILNGATQGELAQIISRYGEERHARRISRAIVENRPLQTSGELASVVERAIGRNRGRIHPATRTFQALRIAVNAELESLEQGLDQAIRLLQPGGRLAVISYHSLEDRLVKGAFRRASLTCVCPPAVPVCTCGHVQQVRLVNKRIIPPSQEEVQRNPRSRSARLRVAEHVEG